jgi:hypothetical protein
MTRWFPRRDGPNPADAGRAAFGSLWTGYTRMERRWSGRGAGVALVAAMAGPMAVLSIYVRRRGSPESKPVGAAHAATGVEG